MPIRDWRVGARLVSLILCAAAGLATAEPNAIAPNAIASDTSERQKAIALFNEDRRLEALPLLEELAQKNPKDQEILVALAGSLIYRAATLSDRDAAARDRFRARDILQRVWEMGSPSPLAQNLRQLLEELPSDGSLEFSRNPQVQQLMVAGEAAFSRRDFPAALNDYTKALQLEPANYSATLFAANTYDREDDFAHAGEWYQRAIQLNPNVETAYRYYADMLARRGEMAEARAMLIHAAVAEPYNKIVWREIRAWAVINHTAFNIVYLPVPVLPKDDPKRRDPADVSSAWRAYEAVRARWQTGGRFREQFPQESEPRHCLAEESEALTAAAKVLEKLEQDKKSAALVAADSEAGLLLKLHAAGLIDAYVLFSLGDDGIAKDYIGYRTHNRARLERYLDEFVLPRVAP